MAKQFYTAIVVILLAFAFSAVSFAQEAAKQEMKKEGKMEMKTEGKDAAMKEMGSMKSFSCDDQCGYMVRSRDGGEVMSAAKNHVKKHHKEMTMTDKQLKDMIKDESAKMNK